MFQTKRQLAMVTAFLLAASASARAQAVRPGTVELGINGGGTFDLPGAASAVGVCFVNTTNCGLKYAPGSKVLGLAGAGAAVSVFKAVWLYADYSYVFKDSSAASVDFSGTRDVATAVRQYSVVVGGLQLALPSVQRFSPYVEIGGGNSTTVTTTSSN